MEPKFYICKHCGNIIVYARNAGVAVMCCGEKMQQISANTTDASQEKHVPVIMQESGRVLVKVGEEPHPMTEQHYIAWICLATEKGYQFHYLCPEDKPEAHFMVCEDDKPVAALAYCNLHGLWKAEI